MNTASLSCVIRLAGDPEQTAADGTNVFGQKNSIYPVLETYQEGSVMDMKVVISTYHWVRLARSQESIDTRSRTCFFCPSIKADTELPTFGG